MNQHVRRKTNKHRLGTPGHLSQAHETKHLWNRQGSDWFARADVLPNLANRPTLVLFLPAKHLWMCGVITCTLVFLHLFKPLVRISSDQLPRDAHSNKEVGPSSHTSKIVRQTTVFCGEFSLSSSHLSMVHV